MTFAGRDSSSPFSPTSSGSPCSDRPIADVDENELEFNPNFIGAGTFAVVYQATWRRRRVAVKKYTRAEHMPYFEAETRQLSRTCHPNVVALYAASSEKRLLVMEFSEMGALDSVIERHRAWHYTAANAISWARQAAGGIAHLHEVGILHRDLKPANMLLFNTGSVLKLTDFGTSTSLQRTFLTSDRGSPAWMAPEVWHTNDYNEKCDVYSWAIILWQILARRQPFENCTMYQVMWNVVNGGRLPKLNKCPNVIWKIITECWDGNSFNRPSMETVHRKMTILQKLYPGGENPLTFTEGDDDDDDESSFSATGLSFNTQAVPADLTIGPGPSDRSGVSTTDSLLDDLGSLAVTGRSTYNRPDSAGSGTNVVKLSSTLTPSTSSSSADALKNPNPNSSTPPIRRPPHLLPSTEQNSPVCAAIVEQYNQLEEAHSRACTKLNELTAVKQASWKDLQKLKAEKAEAQQRIQEYQKISAENEELNNFVRFVKTSQQNQ